MMHERVESREQRTWLTERGSSEDEKGNYPVCDETWPELNVNKTERRLRVNDRPLSTLALSLVYQQRRLACLSLPPLFSLSLPLSLIIAFFSLINPPSIPISTNLLLRWHTTVPRGTHSHLCSAVPSPFFARPPMSLSRILNDHPAPASVPPPPVHQVFNSPLQPNNIISPRHERSPSPSFPPSSRAPISRQSQSSPALERRTAEFASRSGAHKDTSAWDGMPEWRQPSRARNGNGETAREASPSSVQENQQGKNDEPSVVHKKRKRGADDDGDYRPPTTRRVC